MKHNENQAVLLFQVVWTERSIRLRAASNFCKNSLNKENKILPFPWVESRFSRSVPVDIGHSATEAFVLGSQQTRSIARVLRSGTGKP